MKSNCFIKVLMATLLIVVSTGCSPKSTVEDSGNKNNDSYIREETEYYRSIMVADYKGSVDITRSEGDLVSAYEGLSLSDGDDVKVMDHSDLTLNVDSDKHLYADANTHFWLIASGSEGNTKTKIKLEEGSVLCQIKNKLVDNESFEIETPSSTMSVRGTVFRVSLIKGVKNDEVYELVEVFNGGVSTVIEVDGQSVELQPGECALIKEKEDGSDARFVLDDEIDDSFWKSDSMEFDIETESGEGTPILKISYEKLTEMVLERLVEISDSGQNLAVETEVLEQVKETGHNYVEVSRVEPTCVKEGTIVRRCSICGDEISESIPVIEHNYVLVSQTAADCNTSGKIVRRCTMCSDETVETLALTSHNYVQLTRVEPTCAKEGYIRYRCSICGDIKTETLAKTEHKYELSERKEPTCTQDGYIIYKCSVCGDTKTEVLEKLGHNLEEKVVASTCVKQGTSSIECKRCDYVSETKELPLADHTLAVESVKAATCTEDGLKIEKCSVCNNTFETVLKATGHNFVKNEEESTEPTCRENGVDLYNCTNSGCDGQYSKEISKLSHILTLADDKVMCELCKTQYTVSANPSVDNIIFSNVFNPSVSLLADYAGDDNSVYAIVPVVITYTEQVTESVDNDGQSVSIVEAFTVDSKVYFRKDCSPYSSNRDWMFYGSTDNFIVDSNNRKSVVEGKYLDVSINMLCVISALNTVDGQLDYDIIEAPDSPNTLLRLNNATISCSSVSNYSYQMDVFVEVVESNETLSWNFNLTGKYTNPVNVASDSVVNLLNNTFAHSRYRGESVEPYVETISSDSISTGDDNTTTMRLDTSYRACGRADCLYNSHLVVLNSLNATIPEGSADKANIESENQTVEGDARTILLRYIKSILANLGIGQAQEHVHTLEYSLSPMPLVYKSMSVSNQVYSITYWTIVERECSTCEEALLPYGVNAVYTGDSEGNGKWSFSDASLNGKVDMSGQKYRVKIDAFWHN